MKGKNPRLILWMCGDVCCCRQFRIVSECGQMLLPEWEGEWHCDPDTEQREDMAWEAREACEARAAAGRGLTIDDDAQEWLDRFAPQGEGHR